MHPKRFLLPAVLCVFAALPAAAQQADTLITVGGGTPRASNRCGAQEADFTLRAERPLTLVQRAITGLNDDGAFRYGNSTSSAMKRGDTQTINACISEGIPALEICATPEGGGAQRCWTPAYSGNDGSLMLAPGFALSAAAPDTAAPGTGTLISIGGGAVRGGDSCGKADFSLRAERPLTLVQRTITDEGGNGTTTSSAMKRGDTLNISACTYDNALEICATPEGGGREHCWRPFNSRYALTAAPGFALADAPAALDATALQGDWNDRISGRCHMSIAPTEGDRVKVRISWAEGAGADSVWTFSGVWDKAQQQLTYSDGAHMRRKDSGDTTEEKRVWSNGAGTLRHEGGALYWHDAKEQTCKECIFQRAR